VAKANGGKQPPRPPQLVVGWLDNKVAYFLGFAGLFGWWIWIGQRESFSFSFILFFPIIACGVHWWGTFKGHQHSSETTTTTMTMMMMMMMMMKRRTTSTTTAMVPFLYSGLGPSGTAHTATAGRRRSSSATATMARDGMSPLLGTTKSSCPHPARLINKY